MNLNDKKRDYLFDRIDDFIVAMEKEDMNVVAIISGMLSKTIAVLSLGIGDRAYDVVIEAVKKCKEQNGKDEKVNSSGE